MDMAKETSYLTRVEYSEDSCDDSRAEYSLSTGEEDGVQHKIGEVETISLG